MKCLNVKKIVCAATLLASFPAVAGNRKWTKIGTIISPGFGSLVGAAVDAAEEEEHRRKISREQRSILERRVFDAEERNTYLEGELEVLRESYHSKVKELDSFARKEDITHIQKVELDLALEEHKNCLRLAETHGDVRDCYRFYKKKYDEITDIW